MPVCGKPDQDYIVEDQSAFFIDPTGTDLYTRRDKEQAVHTILLVDIGVNIQLFTDKIERVADKTFGPSAIEPYG